MTDTGQYEEQNLTHREHNDPDKHWVGESLPAPSLADVAASVGNLTAAGTSKFPSRANHTHLLDTLDHKLIIAPATAVAGLELRQNDGAAALKIMPGAAWADGDTIGMSFYDANGTTLLGYIVYQKAGGIVMEAIGTDVIRFFTGGLERVSITDGGIGTDFPIKARASGGSSLYLARGDVDTPFMSFMRADLIDRLAYIQANDVTNFIINAEEAGMDLDLRSGLGAVIQFKIGSTEIARISGVSFLVGKTVADATTLGIYMNGSVGNLVSCVENAGSPNLYTNRETAGAIAAAQPFQTYRRTNVQIGSVTIATATTVAFNTSSDETKKHNIRPVPDLQAYDLMRRIEPILFEWNEDNVTDIGYSAQRLAAAWPMAIEIGLVTPGNNLPIDHPDHIGWQMDRSKMVPVLHSAMQAMDRRFEQFRTTALATIQALTARVTALEAA